MEFPLRGADGGLWWCLTRINPLRDAAQNILRWIGINTDVHDQREARRQTEAPLAEVSRQATETAASVREMRDARDEALRCDAEHEQRGTEGA